MKKQISFGNSIRLSYAVLFLCLLWLMVQFILLLAYGIVASGEAIPYHNEENQLIQTGNFSDPKYYFYSVYILLNAFSQLLHADRVGLYILQLLANATATVFFYKIILAVSDKNKRTAFIGTAVLIACIPYQTWNCFLYTESFFCSMVIIFSWFFITAVQMQKKNLLLIIFFLLVLIFSRPTGLYFVPICGGVLLFQFIYLRKYITAFVSGIVALTFFYFILNAATKSPGSYDFMKPFRDKNVLCYIPFDDPKQGEKFTANNSIVSVITYIFQNPAEFLRLSFYKMVTYWGLVRSYYSNAQNIFLICFFYPLYLLAIRGLYLLFKRKKQVVAMFVIMAILIFSASIMLTCDDWSNRFFMPLVPLLIIAAATGLENVYNLFAKRKQSYGFNAN